MLESAPPMAGHPKIDQPRLLLYAMYDPSGQDSAPRVRIARLADALARECELQVIAGGPMDRARSGLAWLIRGRWRTVDAVYVESSSSSPMPQDLLFLAVVRLGGRPVGVYFRDAYQRFRDLYPAPGFRRRLNDMVWRSTLPIFRALATCRFAPSLGLARILGMPGAILLPPGTDPYLPDLGPAPGHRVAYVGALGEADGLPLLLEAMQAVRRSVADAALLVIGPPPSPGLMKQAPAWVEFHQARRSELPVLLGDARLCVIPRPITAYADLSVPVKLMDYLSFGKPIVATAASETRAIVEPTGAGLLVTDAPPALADAIVRVLRDDELAADLAAAARRLAVAPGSTWQARARTIVATLIASPAGHVRLAFMADANSVHTRRWVTFFAERGHRVHLLVASDQVLEPGLHPAILVERYRSYGRRLRPLGALRARRSLRRILTRIRPDVVHAHYLTRYGWLALLSGFRPLVVTVWGSDVLVSPRGSMVARILASLVLRRAAAVTAVSRNLVEAAVALGARRDRIRIVQFGFDSRVFAPGPAPANLRRALDLERRRVVFAPRAVAPIYRQEVIVDALSMLPADVVAVFLERNARPAALAALRDRIATRHLEDRVRFVPDLDEAAMADHYRLADVVVSVPESDAFPVTALEAMASGRPIVLSDLPAAREGLAGLRDQALRAAALVPVGDAKATARAIQAALDMSPDRRESLADELRALALARADRDRELGSMEAVYREIAGATSQRSRG